MQLRVNMETMDEQGVTKPTGGTLSVFDLPSGPGVRVDTFGYSGYRTSAAFDSLLAKVIVHSSSPKWADIVHKAARTLRDFRIGGVATNIPFLSAVLAHREFLRNHITTNFIDTHVAALVGAAKQHAEPLVELSAVAATKPTVTDSSRPADVWRGRRNAYFVEEARTISRWAMAGGALLHVLTVGVMLAADYPSWRVALLAGLFGLFATCQRLFVVRARRERAAAARFPDDFPAGG